MRTEINSAGEWARTYVAHGWSPIPVPFKTKKPNLDGWPNFRLTQADIPDYFDGQTQNIGVILGEASGGLIDIDLDALEAVELAPLLLAATPCRFGRPGKRDSHWLYSAAPSGKTSQYKDTDGSMLVEYRSTGAQTVFPGSTHESGELIEWVDFGEPLGIDGESLKAQVSRLAAAALLARHWPAKGSRNSAALALAGEDEGDVADARTAVLERMPGFSCAHFRDNFPATDPHFIEVYVEGLRKAGMPES